MAHKTSETRWCSIYQQFGAQLMVLNKLKQNIKPNRKYIHCGCVVAQISQSVGWLQD